MFLGKFGTTTKFLINKLRIEFKNEISDCLIFAQLAFIFFSFGNDL